MKLHLSFDYELFFGSHTGSIDKCMLEPTEQLLSLSSKHHVPLIFFIDAGYLAASQRFIDQPSCASDLNRVKAQIKKLHDLGHEIALHVHPHWEDCVYNNGAWKISTRRYKLADFTKEEAQRIITHYHQQLIDITGKPCRSFRAGGWCIQPFLHIKEALAENGLFTDSSVYSGGYHASPAHYFDYRSAPQMAEWRFENDCCVESEAGKFHEVPTTSEQLSPLFYWQLYLRMKLDPSRYKPVGDGSWLKDKKRIYKQFYSSTHHFASADGYFASRLKGIFTKAKQKGDQRMMVLSHPKSLAPCSFDLLEEFIEHARSHGANFHTLTGSHA